MTHQQGLGRCENRGQKANLADEILSRLLRCWRYLAITRNLCGDSHTRVADAITNGCVARCQAEEASELVPHMMCLKSFVPVISRNECVAFSWATACRTRCRKTRTDARIHKQTDMQSCMLGLLPQ